MEELDDSGISLLPSRKFPTMRVVLDSVGFISDLPLTFDMTVAFPVARLGRLPQTMRFSELNGQPGCYPVNASLIRLPVTTHHSGPKLMASLYFVRLFHSLLSCGLCRRSVLVLDVRELQASLAFRSKTIGWYRDFSP